VYSITKLGSITKIKMLWLISQRHRLRLFRLFQTGGAAQSAMSFPGNLRLKAGATLQPPPLFPPQNHVNLHVFSPWFSPVDFAYTSDVDSPQRGNGRACASHQVLHSKGVVLLRVEKRALGEALTPMNRVLGRVAQQMAVSGCGNPL
jgi:hypothetical protein